MISTVKELRFTWARQCFILLGLTACGQPNAEDQRPVILISIDSLRADHCTPYGHSAGFSQEESTPFLQRMAEEGVVFENCSAAAPWTLPSHIGILTAMHPMEHGVRARRFRLPEDTENIAGKFKHVGYQTAAFYSAPFLHPSWGYYPGFDTYVGAAPYLNSAEATDAMMNAGTPEIKKFHDAADTDKENAPHVVDRALEWLEKDNRKEEPFFLFLHFWDPHYNYQAPDRYNRMFLPEVTDADRELGETFTPRLPRDYSADEILRLKALYDAEIRYTDDQIARLFAQLEQWGLGNEVIIAVVSDHGDHFGEHGHYYHHRTLYEEVTHVPMVLRAPGLLKPAQRVAGSVANYDVGPTLLDLAGLSAWPERSGRSALPLLSGGSHEVQMDLLHPGQKLDLRGWREAQNKVIWDTRMQTFSAWDLMKDPAENQPAYLSSPNETAVSSKASAAFRAAEAAAGQAAAMTEDPEMKRKLAELGYIDG